MELKQAITFQIRQIPREEKSQCQSDREFCPAVASVSTAWRGHLEHILERA